MLAESEWCRFIERSHERSRRKLQVSISCIIESARIFLLFLDCVDFLSTVIG